MTNSTTTTMQRLMIFIDETDRYHHANLGTAILEKLRGEGLIGATILRGIAGFGSGGKIHTTAILDLAVSLPEILITIDTPEKIQAVLPHLQEMLTNSLIAIDEVQAIRNQPPQK